MTLSALVQMTSWADVKAALLWLYPDAREAIGAYRRVFSNIRRMKPSASIMRICIEKTQYDGEDHPVDEIVGRNGALNRDQDDFAYLGENSDSSYALRETDFSIALEPRPHWLGMGIDEETMCQYPAPQIVAHCLWEMTFHGFAEAEVAGFRQELDSRIAKVDAMTDEEKEQYLIPAEQVFERLRSRLEPLS